MFVKGPAQAELDVAVARVVAKDPWQALAVLWLQVLAMFVDSM